MDYLGHVITIEGVRVDPDKIKAMQMWPKLKTITALHGFLRLTGYYRKFVKDYRTFATPLTQMMKKGGFQWNEEGEQAFENLKKAMISTPVLAMLDFNALFEIYIDASNIDIGAVLVQKGQPLTYMSKVLGSKKVEWLTYVK